MTWDVAQFNKLVDAEEYFEFFQLPYDQKFVNVNRLHILKKFSKFMGDVDEQYPELSNEEKLNKYREALEQAYQVFTESTPLEQKLFKVFNEQPKNIVMLRDLSSSV
ncbi:MAG: nitrogenase-stabilizing/protective protein NifW [Nostocaceae cyanobacterium]|nr:nitrogenase-stabilizing/protective protein NifW [Nostocaceae cyanobacterium]